MCGELKVQPPSQHAPVVKVVAGAMIAEFTVVVVAVVVVVLMVVPGRWTPR